VKKPRPSQATVIAQRSESQSTLPTAETLANNLQNNVLYSQLPVPWGETV